MLKKSKLKNLDDFVKKFVAARTGIKRPSKKQIKDYIERWLEKHKEELKKLE